VPVSGQWFPLIFVGRTYSGSFFISKRTSMAVVLRGVKLNPSIPCGNSGAGYRLDLRFLLFLLLSLLVSRDWFLSGEPYFSKVLLLVDKLLCLLHEFVEVFWLLLGQFPHQGSIWVDSSEQGCEGHLVSEGTDRQLFFVEPHDVVFQRLILALNEGQQMT
jgi:hypothetical protein